MGDFQRFGLSHGIVLLLLLWGSAWILRTRRASLAQIQRYSIGGGLILQILIFHSYYLIRGEYDLARYLPFHLCALSAVMMAMALLIDRPWLRQITIYWAPFAALIAILLPDIGASDNFPSFRFLEFFVSHALICWGAVWLLANHRFKWTIKTALFAYGSLFATLPPIALVNRLFSANYLYMLRKPNGGQMDFLGPEPYHFGYLLLLVMLVFWVEMLVFRLVQQRFKPR
ncbi:MAG: TIGR02206 family membrane protein [Alkalinema sp. RU_4_3]|nr:TIGR02206 family membrane protein [Alkalinema sp. RU_4_3]